MLLPVGLVTAWAGYRARSPTHVLAAAAAIVLPRVLIDLSLGLVTGRPIAHDIHLHDTYYVVGPYGVGILVEVLAFVIAIGLLAVLFRWIRRSFGYDESLANRPGG
jgi:heme/copper-type cytochrome/quinol oxidase subunit 1